MADFHITASVRVYRMSVFGGSCMLGFFLVFTAGFYDYTAFISCFRFALEHSM